jgi:hypothetical protein
MRSATPRCPDCRNILPSLAGWVSICYAAQAGSHLDAIYGPLQGRAIRDVTPAVLIMYGSHERELMESAGFWAGKANRSSQSYNHNSDDKTTHRSFAGALEPEELLPRKTGEARLVPRGTPGQMVELLDWAEFCCYLDEVRAARISDNSIRVRNRMRVAGGG